VVGLTRHERDGFQLLLPLRRDMDVVALLGLVGRGVAELLRVRDDGLQLLRL
jgi:hypothetical protein